MTPILLTLVLALPALEEPESFLEVARRLQALNLCQPFDSGDTNFETCLPSCKDDVVANCGRCGCKTCTECRLYQDAIAANTPCSSSFNNDLNYESCFPWCSNSLTSNCNRCRCKRCSACRTFLSMPNLPPPPSPLSPPSPPSPPAPPPRNPPPPPPPPRASRSQVETSSPPASPSPQNDTPPILATGADALEENASSTGMTTGSIIAIVIIVLVLSTCLAVLVKFKTSLCKSCPLSCRKPTHTYNHGKASWENEDAPWGAGRPVKVIDYQAQPLSTIIRLIDSENEAKHSPVRPTRRPVEDSPNGYSPSPRSEGKSPLTPKAAEERRDRIDQARMIAANRFAKKSLALGFATWQANFLDHQRRMNVLKSATSRLARPKLATALGHWKATWENVELDNEEQAPGTTAKRKSRQTLAESVWKAIVPEDN